MPFEKWTSPQIDRSHMGRSHTSPEKLGLVARDAEAGLPVTTHMMPESEPHELRDIIRRDYAGRLTIGEDLMTL